jgi:DNA-binding CsgD family transcriptional regulator
MEPELTSPATAPPRPASAEGLLGRGAAQRAAGALLDRAGRGTGGVLLIEGEPGSGRSALLCQAVSRAAGRGFTLAAGAADQLGEALPLFALRAALGEPFARRTAGAPDEERPGAAAWWTGQVRAYLAERADAGPVLVCLDDLQWAGPGTLAALRTLPPQLRRRPVAWLLARTTGAGPESDRLFTLLERDGAARLQLGPLPEDAVAALLAGALGAPPAPELLNLARGAAGNPALLAALAGGLAEEQASQGAGDGAGLLPGRLPGRLHSLARRRLDGLSPQARQLLETGAVLGRSFRLEDAAEMLGRRPAALLPFLEEVMTAGVMTAAGNEFSFRQEMLRQAVSELIPRPAAAALQRQYAQILLSQAPALAELDLAVGQLLSSAPRAAADLALRALELTPPADRRALPRGVAAAEALTAAGRLEQAAGLAGGLLAQPLPGAAEDRVRAALAALLCARGQPREAAGQAAAVLARPGLAAAVREHALTARLQALTGLQDERAGAEADAVLAEGGRPGGPAAVAALVARAFVSWEDGQVSGGLELLREAARRDAGSGADARAAQPVLALAAVLADLRQTRQAEELVRAADTPARQGIPAQAVLALLQARLLLAAGRLADAAAAAGSAVTTAEALGAAGYAATARSLLSVIELRRGDLAAAAGQLASRPAGPQLADRYARAAAGLAPALVREARDGPAAVLGQVRDLCGGGQGVLLGDPAAAAWLARTALAAGDPALAAGVAGAARRLASASPGWPALAAAAAHAEGLVRRDAARLAEAVAQHPDRWARASAAEDLGLQHGAQGETRQAIGYLEEALDGYREAGAARDEARVRRRLRQLGIRRRHWSTPADRPATGWDSLTGTEQAVAGLVAEGLNNGQVAARLYISTHTVAHHLRQSFRKLQISSRVELARIVIEQGGQADGDLGQGDGSQRGHGHRGVRPAGA